MKSKRKIRKNNLFFIICYRSAIYGLIFFKAFDIYSVKNVHTNVCTYYRMRFVPSEENHAESVDYF